MGRTKYIIIFILLLAGTNCLNAQDDRSLRTIDIEGISITARRTLSAIGTQKTVMDSMTIRDDISKSIADVLSRGSSVFIKSYGRATLSTASFRGTAASHTQVTWNGMKLNSPMLGSVDFSLIPSYFVDDVNLYHGGSSVGGTGGGLGGAVTLANRPSADKGFGLSYIQGIGNFSTFDQYMRLTYGGERLSSSTRVFYGTSKNDFSYTNYNKEIFIYDTEGNITGSYYPREKNRNGGFGDLHIMQELYYDSPKAGRFSLAAWHTNSERGIPFLNTDYREETEHKFLQKDNTTRLTAGWEKVGPNSKLSALAGYSYTDFEYSYDSDLSQGDTRRMINSRNFIHTAFAKAGWEHYRGDKWLFSADVTANQNMVDSRDRNIQLKDGKGIIGYREARFDISAFAAVRYKPSRRLGLALNLREELYGNEFSPLIPAAFAEYTISEKYGIVAKASVARNYRYPTLSDLFTQPGGNKELLPEEGLTYDAGAEFSLGANALSFKGEATYYNSYIKNWILWMPSNPPEVWSPRNVKEVRSSGVELKGKLGADLGRLWKLGIDANYTLANSVNRDDYLSPDDVSVGKQLPYVPKHSASVSGRLSWKGWAFTYKFVHYSRRYTSTDNNDSPSGYLGAYYMSDISLEKGFDTGWAHIYLKLVMNNIFNEEYEMILSRPMPGRNFGLFIQITPKLRSIPKN